MWNLKNKKTNKKQKQTCKYRELMGYQSGGAGEMNTWVKRNERYRCEVTERTSHGTARRSTRNVGNGIVIVLCGDRCSHTYGEHSITYRLVQSLHCALKPT